MAHAFPRFAAVLALSVLATACSRKSAPAPEPAQRAEETPVASASAAEEAGAAPKPLAAGSPVLGARPIELGVYLATPPSAALIKSTQDAVKARFPGVALRSGPGDKNVLPSVLVASPPIGELSPPTEEQIRYLGRGLDAKQATAAAASKGVLLMAFALPRDPAMTRLREAQKLALEIAQKNGGFVWDETTRQLFSPAAWNDERVQGWDGDRPDMRRHVTIHYYEAAPGRHRAITLGMIKFGLPDLVVEDLPQNESLAMTTIVDAAAQVLVEGAVLGPGGVLDLDLTSIHHAAAHDAILGSTSPGAKLRGRIALVVAPREEGDPDNRLVAMTFPSFVGVTDGERQADAITALVGAAPDPLAGAPEDDKELAAATARVQKRLPAVAAAFGAGLPLGERVIVKAPFKTDDGSIEWMWVGVTGWKGEVVTGRLENEPFKVKALHLGAKVDVKQASVADYVWVDGAGKKKEGGESAEILGRREGNKK